MSKSKDMNKKELWKPVEHEQLKNKYEVSNLGNLRNNVTKVIIACSSIRGGYKSAYLVKEDGDSQMFKLHRLVALTFVSNDDPKKYTIVNHIDGNKMNNKVENLEWVTATQNVQHAVDTGLIKITKRAVVQIDKTTGKEITRFESLKEACEKTGVDDGSICKVCKGRQQTAGGYKWKFADENENEMTGIVVDLDDYKQIKDFDNYWINEEGKIYSKPYQKFLKFQTNNDGYYHVQLTNKGNRKDFLVHRLVAEYFVTNNDPENKILINIKDGNKQNYHANNLVWASTSDNATHRVNQITKNKTNTVVEPIKTLEPEPTEATVELLKANEKIAQLEKQIEELKKNLPEEKPKKKDKSQNKNALLSSQAIDRKIIVVPGKTRK